MSLLIPERDNLCTFIFTQAYNKCVCRRVVYGYVRFEDVKVEGWGQQSPISCPFLAASNQQAFPEPRLSIKVTSKLARFGFCGIKQNKATSQPYLFTS